MLTLKRLLQPASNPRRAPVAYSSRAPILLLCLLLVNTLGVAALAWYALSGEQAEADKNRQQAERLALDALTVQLEHALYQAVLDPLLMLRTLYRQGAGESELQQVLDSHAFVRGLFVFDRHLSVTRAWPPAGAATDAFVMSQVVGRIRASAVEDSPANYEVQTLADVGRAPMRLYAFQSIGAGSAGNAPRIPLRPLAREWVAIGCDTDVLSALIVRPRLEQFRAKQRLRVVLRAPGEAGDADAIVAPLSYALPGWRLEMLLPANPTRLLEGAQWPTVATSVGLLFAIALIGLVILWEFRRQHALLELRNRFVANVSHELRTPLSLIRMYAETLYLRRLNDTAKQHEYHGIILSEAERLSRMIGDTLDFSRLRQGHLVSELAQRDLRSTVAGVAAAYAAEWRKRGGSVRLDIAEDVAPVAHDREGITQIVLNLVDNAIKYGASGSEIVLRLHSNGERVELAIIDYGPGLASDVQQRLWRAVQSGDIFDEANGSGLGLSLVKRIGDAHHGRFEMTRTAGSRGLTVILSFPANRVAV